MALGKREHEQQSAWIDRRLGTLKVLGLSVQILLCGAYLTSTLQRHSDARDIDTRFWYAAGQCCRQGVTPYSPEKFRQVWDDSDCQRIEDPVTFAYPPTFLPWCVASTVFHWPGAGLFFNCVNLCALGVTFVSLYTIWHRRFPAIERWEVAFLISLGTFVAAVPTTLFTGQTGLLATCGVALTLLGCERNNSAATTAGLLLASIKPQLTGLSVLWCLLAYRSKRTLVPIGVAMSLLTIYLLVYSPASFLADFKTSAALYRLKNQLDPYADLSVLLQGHTSIGPAQIVLAAAAFLIVGLAAIRTTGWPPGGLALPVAATICLSPTRPYDWVLLILCFPLLALPTLGWRSRVSMLILLCLLARAPNLLQQASKYASSPEVGLIFVAALEVAFLCLAMWQGRTSDDYVAKALNPARSSGPSDETPLMA